MANDFDECLMDAKLKIETTGRNDSFSDTFRYPYEPTTYSVLDRIAWSGYIEKEDLLVDYGSGKGRVPIYMNYKLGCKSIGIEMMPEFMELAKKNLSKYEKAQEVSFIETTAEKWKVEGEATCFFFFNPFSGKILQGVMNNLLDSYYEAPRRMRLFFYYPSDEFIAFLMGVEELEFVDEIDCMDLFEKKDDRNRVMIFELP